MAPAPPGTRSIDSCETGLASNHGQARAPLAETQTAERITHQLVNRRGPVRGQAGAAFFRVVPGVSAARGTVAPGAA